MAQSLKPALPSDDDIDHLVDDLLKNPDLADQVKDNLRARLKEAHHASAKPADVVQLHVDASARVDDQDVDDLWDNVPI